MGRSAEPLFRTFSCIFLRQKDTKTNLRPFQPLCLTALGISDADDVGLYSHEDKDLDILAQRSSTRLDLYSNVNLTEPQNSFIQITWLVFQSSQTNLENQKGKCSKHIRYSYGDRVGLLTRMTAFSHEPVPSNPATSYPAAIVLTCTGIIYPCPYIRHRELTRLVIKTSWACSRS